MEDVIGFFAIVWVALIFIVGAFAAKKSQDAKINQKVSNELDLKKEKELREKREAERKKREELARFPVKTASGLAVSTLENYRMKSSFEQMHGDHSHGSGRDETEYKEDIIGSLGASYDEGCPGLVNTRLLTKTAEEGEDKKAYNYDQIAATIVFGSVLSEPKWKE